jgi:hypothetical protein
MSSHDLQDILRDLIEDDGLADDQGDTTLRRIETFAEAGVLTRNSGLVIRLLNGSEFQLTIVRSARGREDYAEDDS